MTVATAFSGQAPALLPPSRTTVSTRLILAIWALLSIGLLLILLPDIPGMKMGDPDDVMRLVQVRDLVAGQSWFDVHQYRVDAPQGVLMHWSRLVDLPLATGILLLRPLLGQHMAELVTSIIVPLLTMLCAVTIAMRMTARLFDRETAIIAGLMVGISGPMLHQMQPLRIDHHGWQLVAALIALMGFCREDARKGGWIAGIGLAAGLAISLEGLPLAAMFIGVASLRGMRDGEWDWLLHTMLAFATGTCAFFLGTRGLTDLAQHCDAVSPMHIAAFLVGATGSTAVALLRPRNPLIAIGILGAAGIASAAIVVLAAPQCAGGAFGGMDPMVRKYWLENIPEGLPVWRSNLKVIAALISFVPLGLYGVFQLWRKAPDARRAFWVDYALLLIGATVIGLLLSRAMTTAAAIALVPAARQIRQWRLASLKVDMNRRLAIDVAMMVAVLPAFPVAAAYAIVPHKAGDTGDAPSRLANCNFAKGLAPLNALPVTDVFAPVDISPDILLRTHQRVVATGHHRAGEDIRDVMAAFMAEPEAARTIVKRHHATLLTMCGSAPEMLLYSQLAPHGLAAALRAGHVPAWLEPIDFAPGTHIRYWRVR